MMCVNDIDIIYDGIFIINGLMKCVFMLQVTINSLYSTLKCCQLIQECLLAAKCSVFGYNSAAEFHKLCCSIWQNLPRKNGGPEYNYLCHRLASKGIVMCVCPLH